MAYDPTTGTSNIVANFSSTTGGFPKAPMIQASNGLFYGTTTNGGANGDGTLFSFNSSTNAITKLVDFTSATDGGNCIAAMTQASNGNLYGIQRLGGSSGAGTLFEYVISTNTFTVLYEFNHGTSSQFPLSQLLEVYQNVLYGTSSSNSGSGNTIFSYDLQQQSFSTPINFNAGIVPEGSLSETGDGRIFATFSGGNSINYGSLYEFLPDVNGYDTLSNFSVSDSRDPGNVKLTHFVTTPCTEDSIIDVQNSCEPITWIDGNTYSASNNTAFVQYTNQNGCDSTIYLDFTFRSCTITVTNTNNSGAGSLRQALADAYDGDTINFAVSGVITVSSPLDISKDIYIDDPGADVLAIDGNDTTKVFRDGSYSINEVTISGLEIRHGKTGAYGAGIGVLGANLKVIKCNIHSNEVTASYGAGISVWSMGSSLTVENSSIHDNIGSAHATGIYVTDGANLNIFNSTIYGNTGSGGGLGIWAEGSDIVLKNVTVAGHSNGGEAMYAGDYNDYDDPSNDKVYSLIMENCIFDNGTLNYYSYSTMGASETSNGNNIVNDNSMSFLNSTGDLKNTSADLDPNGLQDNGGTTPTIGLQCSSPAIDAGSAVFATDQNGGQRYGSVSPI